MHCRYDLDDDALLHIVYMRSWRHFGYPFSRLSVSFPFFCSTWSAQFAIMGRDGCRVPMNAEIQN
jgi:hypothetical protein